MTPAARPLAPAAEGRERQGPTETRPAQTAMLALAVR
jgi:hypothetical protein